VVVEFPKSKNGKIAKLEIVPHNKKSQLYMSIEFDTK
jgi:hypothetical protein